jgi:hypothetical protein
MGRGRRVSKPTGRSLHVGVDELDAPQLQEEGESVNVVGVSMFRRRMLETLANGWGRGLNGVGDGCGRYEKNRGCLGME